VDNYVYGSFVSASNPVVAKVLQDFGEKRAAWLS